MKNLGVLDKGALTMDISLNNGTTLPIDGIIKSIPYYIEGVSIMMKKRGSAAQGQWSKEW